MSEKQIDIITITSFEDLLAQISPDYDLILTSGARPLAKVTFIPPLPPKPERIADLHAGICLSPQFDDLLPKEFWVDKS